MHASSSDAASTGLILVVDDQSRNLRTLKTVLTQDGFEVVTAERGQEALFCLAARVPDLVLLDVLMPGMDGFEVCREIKKNSATKDIPVIFLSGSTEQQSIIRGFEAGGVDYITKPFTKAELLARVHTHLELVHTHRLRATQAQEKSRMLGMIAEEWHQPLQRIALLTKQLTAHAPAGDAPLAAEAHAQLERMLLSIELFLQTQSLQERRDSQSSYASDRLTSNVETLAGRWYLTAKRNCVDLRITAPSTPPLVAASPFAARQIVDTLLSNAIGFTPRDGSISVHINRAADLIIFDVINDGPGFPEEYLHQQFQPYVKRALQPADGRTLGLGLAAAKRTADRIGATLTISNAPSGGARATATFHTASVDLVSETAPPLSASLQTA